MAPNTDPYRTLELPRGATLAEVKQAYRRLAKANHPDRAGEAALPRFLAIRAAYDQIVGPDGRSRRSTGATGSSSGGSPAGDATRRPWDADPDRAGATRRAYGGRPRRARPTPGSRSRSGPGSTEGADPGPRPPNDDRPQREPNKATLGSTSYDGVDPERFEPDWAGASWYGTTSGTYWTLNPKEYADPRKHGPEYQARARRQWLGGSAGSMDPGQPATSGAATPAGGEPEVPSEPATTDELRRPPTRTSASWWETIPGEPPLSTNGSASEPATTTRSRPAPGPGSARGAAPPRPTAAADRVVLPPELSTDTLTASVRGWLDASRPGPGSRVGRAVLGWAPIALGIGWIAGEMTGCGRFSADCDPSVAPISWLAQIVALGLLLLVPRLARIATIATLATLAAVIPGAVLLLATSDPAAVTAGRTALGGLMIIAWVAGVVFGLVRDARSVRRPRPVS